MKKNFCAFTGVAALAICGFAAIAAAPQGAPLEASATTAAKSSPVLTFAFSTFISVEKNCIALVGVNNAIDLNALTKQHLAIVLDDAVGTTPAETLNSLHIACFQKLMAAGLKL